MGHVRPRGCAADPGGDGAPKGLVQRPFEKGHPGTKIRPAGCRPGHPPLLWCDPKPHAAGPLSPAVLCHETEQNGEQGTQQPAVGSVPDAFYDQDSRQRGGKRRGKADQEALQKSPGGGDGQRHSPQSGPPSGRASHPGPGESCCISLPAVQPPPVVGGGMEPAVGSGGAGRTAPLGQQ